MVDERRAVEIIMCLRKSNPLEIRMLPLAQVQSQEYRGTGIMCIKECEKHNQDRASHLLSEQRAARRVFEVDAFNSRSRYCCIIGISTALEVTMSELD